MLLRINPSIASVHNIRSSDQFHHTSGVPSGIQVILLASPTGEEFPEGPRDTVCAKKPEQHERANRSELQQHDRPGIQPPSPILRLFLAPPFSTSPLLRGDLDLRLPNRS